MRKRLSAETVAIIREYGEDVHNDERRTGLRCPFCGGGQSGERSFGVSRSSTGDLFYRCFRVRCGAQGRCDGSRGYLREDERQVPQLLKPRSPEGRYTRDLGAHGETLAGSFWESRLLEQYGLHSGDWQFGEFECLWKGTPGEILCIPLRDPKGETLAYEFKPFAPRNVALKTVCELVPGYSGPVMGFYKFAGGDTEGPVVLCEDSISALKASKCSDAVSLVGTILSEDKAYALRETFPDRPLFLSLDKDATETAARTVRKYRLVLPNLVLRPIHKDLKYFSTEELRDYFNLGSD